MPEETAQTDATQGTETKGTPDTAAATGSSDANKGGSLEELLSGLDDASRKAVLSEVSRARNEAAKYRTEKRELEPLAEEAQKLREAAKSDIEKLTERAANAEKTATDKDLQIARLTAVLKHGLELDDVELLGGSSADEIAAKAERFAARLGAGKALSGRPKESLKGGAGRDDEADPDEMDPAKLAARVLARQYG